MKSILLVGQSNIAGRGFLNEVKPLCHERVKVLRNGRWQWLLEPIHNDRPVAGVSFAASFAEAWVEAHPNEVLGLIPCAEGGSAIAEWDPSGVLFQHAISEAKFAMAESELIGILWHQGESDSHSGLHSCYGTQLNLVLSGFRTALEAPNLPIAIGGLPDFLGKVAFGQHCTEYQHINDIIETYAKASESVYFVSAKGLSANPDGIHINSLSQRIFGLRYFEAFQNQRHIWSPLVNEEASLETLNARSHSAAEMSFLRQVAFSRGEMSFETFMNQEAGKAWYHSLYWA